MFENVTYTQYSSVLGRSVIPDETTFNKYTLENEMYIKRILAYLDERETNGIDNAVCLMNEIDYIEEQKTSASAASVGVVSSESVSGHSISYDRTSATKEAELNAKSIETKKMQKIKLFCDVSTGVM